MLFLKAPSILSHDMHVVGKIFSTGDIQIEGRLDGDLRSHAVTIGEKAVVSGEVAGDTVTVVLLRCRPAVGLNPSLAASS